eukprot:COSAG01_NODE_423_length_17260_cov_203.736962_8_plen_186_part_00
MTRGSATCTPPISLVGLSYPASTSNCAISTHESNLGSSLHDVAKRGDVPGVQAGLQAGVNPDLRDGYEYTALHDAAMNGHAAVVGALVGGGATVGAEDWNGRIALHEAAIYGHAAVVEALVGIPNYGCTRVPTTAVGELTVGELIFSHSYNFFFGREFALGATIGAMAKFAHVTNRHKISYKLNV